MGVRIILAEFSLNTEARLYLCKCPLPPAAFTPEKTKLAIFKNGMLYFRDLIFKCDVYLPFKFNKYPGTNLVNGFEKMKWQHLLGISNC